MAMVQGCTRAPSWMLLALVLAAARLQAAGTQEAAVPELRVFLDDHCFVTNHTALLREAFSRLPGASVVGASACPEEAGRFQPPDSWDVMFTLDCKALLDRGLGQRQQASCLPGDAALTSKSRLFASLRAAFGAQRAAAISPLTYVLPGEFDQLAAQVEQEAAPAGWVLKKERAHKGQGVHILAPREALQAASERTRLGRAVYPVAQRLLSNQLLVDGRPLILRSWVLVCGTDPLRAYMYRGGLVTLGSTHSRGSAGAAGEAPSGAAIVNVALMSHSEAREGSWSLSQLEEHLASRVGWPAVESLRRRLRQVLVATVAAGLAPMRAAAAGLPGSFWGLSGGFQLLGADILIDADLKPWVIEVNTPSLRLLYDEHGWPVAHVFNDLKEGLTLGIARVVLARHAALWEGLSAAQFVKREEAAAAGSGFDVLTSEVRGALDNASSCAVDSFEAS